MTERHSGVGQTERGKIHEVCLGQTQYEAIYRAATQTIVGNFPHKGFPEEEIRGCM